MKTPKTLARTEKEKWDRRHKIKPKIKDNSKNKKLKRFY